MITETVESEESGPISTGIWDTRTRENSRWCSKCRKWLRLTTFSWCLSMDAALQYHREHYCKGTDQK